MIVYLIKVGYKMSSNKKRSVTPPREYVVHDLVSPPHSISSTRFINSPNPIGIVVQDLITPPNYNSANSILSIDQRRPITPPREYVVHDLVTPPHSISSTRFFNSPIPMGIVTQDLVTPPQPTSLPHSIFGVVNVENLPTPSNQEFEDFLLFGIPIGAPVDYPIGSHGERVPSNCGFCDKILLKEFTTICINGEAKRVSYLECPSHKVRISPKGTKAVFQYSNAHDTYNPNSYSCKHGRGYF